MTNYSHVLEDTIFPSFIRSCVPNVNLEELKRESYLMQQNEESIKASNYNGYHSPSRKNTDRCENYKNFEQLIHIVKEFSQDTADYYNLDIRFSNLYWWVNINKSYQYNFLHSHFRADLIGAFYINCSENCGDLTIVRKDGSEYGNLYSGRYDMLEIGTVPEPGRLFLIPGHLWHYVKVNESHEDRISVAFNIYF